MHTVGLPPLFPISGWFEDQVGSLSGMCVLCGDEDTYLTFVSPPALRPCHWDPARIKSNDRQAVIGTSRGNYRADESGGADCQISLL